MNRSGQLLMLVAVFATAALPHAVHAQRHGKPGPVMAADGSVDWNRYYTSGETNAILEAYARRYPQLTKLYSIGKSWRGADLMLIEVTNQATGPAEEKPAQYLDGGIHAGELTGSAVALYVLGHLLDNYGRDARITRLLDTRTIYIRPKFNPDGSDLALIHDQSLRSSVHPVDDDGDGVADEDPGDDLDGDGWITQMRIPDPQGNRMRDANDPRILLARPEGATQGTFYRVIGEGLDNDGDGRINEDGIGGLDMNRNFPRNWELEFRQPGAGEFPLSEPETYATVKFINAHPNIMSVVHGHTSGGFVYRLPSASAPSLFNTTDLALIEELGAYYTQTTGRPVRPSATHPTDHRYGTLIEWAYQDRGIIGWVPEYSPADAWITDYDRDGRISEAERHRFNDEELDGAYFSPWTPYQHPQLGPVEIGGWHAKFWGQNPPAEFLERECEQQLEWILYLAEQSPLMAVSAPSIAALGGDRYRVTVTVTNTGFLPTNLTERGHMGRELDEGGLADQIVRPPVATIALDGAELAEGAARVTLPHLDGSNAHSKAVTQNATTVTWIVRASAPAAAVRVLVAADKGGTVRTESVPLR
jgi:murein tripeptide amidase MpaA